MPTIHFLFQVVGRISRWYAGTMVTLTSAEKRLLQTLMREHGLDFVVAFGSQVAGRTHADSDLDIGFSSRQPLDYRGQYQLEQALQSVFPDQPVELVDLSQASPLLRKKALMEGQLLAQARPHSFVRAQMLAYRLYLDAAPLRYLARSQ